LDETIGGEEKKFGNRERGKDGTKEILGKGCNETALRLRKGNGGKK